MKKNFLITLFLCSVIVIAFFYKTVFYKQVPFPGDLLVAEYNPWKSYSFLGYNPGSYPNKAQYFDTLRQIYPWKTFVINSLENSSFPLWNPHNFSGSPLLANFQSAVFYPFNFVYFLFPQIWAWTSLVMLQPFLALIFTFLYSRKIGISRLGSYFASISFSFSSFMTVWLEYNTIGHVILWLPLILLSLEKLFEKKTVIWPLILAFSIVSSLFAGHIQIFTYLLMFVLIYTFARKRKVSLFLVCLFALSLGIGALQVIPGIELIMQAARSAHSYDLIVNKILIQSWQLVMLFVPDFFGNPATRNYWIQDTYVGDVIYIGLIPLFFVALSFFIKKNFFVKFFILTTAIFFILITLNPLTQLIYKINIPLISSSSSNLLVFIICFSMSILCGFGIDVFIKNKYSFKKIFQILIPFILVFVVLWFVVIILPKFHLFGWENNLSISSRNLLYATSILILAISLFVIAIFNNKLKHAIVICLLLITICDLWKNFQKFNPFSPVEFTFPTTSIFEFVKNNNGINRYWGYGSGIIEANFATQNLVFSTDGYDPLYPKRYGEFIQASADGKIATEFTNRTRSDAFIANGDGEEKFAENHFRLKILDLLGVKYILDRNENTSIQEDFPLDRFSLVYEQDGWKIFENKKSVPRLFLANNYKIFFGKEDFEKIFFDNSLDASKTVLLEEYPGFQANDLGKIGELDLISYLPHEININVRTISKNILFLSDTYYPGWKAYIDGKETKIYRANYAFRAITVPTGDHRVKFIFDPMSFKIGYVISLASLVLLIALLLTVKKRPYAI